MVTYSREFDKMGITVTNARGELKSTYEVLLEMSDYYSKAENKTQALAIATTLLGRRGAELVPLLQLGREGIEALGEEASQLGIVMDQKTASAMKVFADKVTAIKTGIKGFSISVTKGLLPAITVLANKIKNINWADERVQMWAKKVVVGVLDGLSAISRFALGVRTVWRALIYAMTVLIGTILIKFENFKIAIETLKIGVFSAAQNIVESLKTAVERIKPIADILGIEVVDNIYNRLGDAVSDFTEKMDGSKGAIDQAKENIKAYGAEMETAWENVKNAGKEINVVDNVTKGFIKDVRENTKVVKENVNAIRANADAYEDLGESTEEAREKVKSFQDYMKDWADGAKDVAKNTADIVTTTMDGISSGTASAFRKALQEGKDFGASMKAMFQDLLFDIMEMLIKSQINQALAGLFNIGGAAGGGAGGGLLGGIFGFIGSLFGHEGGMVTKKGIQRFHNGGWPGLRNDEVPAILQTGERVLNRREASEYSGKEKEPPIYNITINAVDAQSFAMLVRRNPEAIIGVVGENMSRNGSLRSISRATA
jgi:methyl-accepting chemotaxis protein